MMYLLLSFISSFLALTVEVTMGQPALPHEPTVAAAPERLLSRQVRCLVYPA
jgi:hypothetical protein